MPSPHALSDAEYDALRALQDNAKAPAVEDPVWEYLVSAGLVWIDRTERVHAVRLTPIGRSCPRGS